MKISENNKSPLTFLIIDFYRNLLSEKNTFLHSILLQNLFQIWSFGSGNTSAESGKGTKREGMFVQVIWTVVLCHVVLWCVMLCYVIMFHVVLCYVMLLCVMLFCDVLSYVLMCHVVLWCVVLCYYVSYFLLLQWNRFLSKLTNGVLEGPKGQILIK